MILPFYCASSDRQTKALDQTMALIGEQIFEYMFDVEWVSLPGRSAGWEHIARKN